MWGKMIESEELESEGASSSGNWTTTEGPMDTESTIERLFSMKIAENRGRDEDQIN